MKVPARSAAAMRNSPARAVASRPSMVKVTGASGSPGGAMAWCDVTTGSAMGAPAFLDVHQELVAEHAQRGGDRGRDGRPQHADGRLLRRPRHTRGDVVAGIHEQVEIRLATRTVLDAAQDLLEPAAALPARRALAARLPPEEPGDPPGGAHHTGGVVHDHDRPRAEH